MVFSVITDCPAGCEQGAPRWIGETDQAKMMAVMTKPALVVLVMMGWAGGLLAENDSKNSEPAEEKEMATVVTPLDSSDLRDFEKNSPAVRALIEKCLPLTHQNLGYKYGSSSPSDGGMDCSGTIFYVLRQMGIDDVPRTASDQYVWARKADNFEAVVSRKKDSFELDELAPGDLLFWTGTYTTERDPPVTHTMIYLGKLKSDGRQVMFGSSDGRTYGGRKMYGVSVFDFTIPKPKDKGQGPGSVFIGYATIPGLVHSAPTDHEASPTPAPHSTPEAKKKHKEKAED
jgi:cell wall-associated NlpC family hydrolase